ncbi:MAG TPA: hypothetical protein VN830_07900 [Verrucomicrobiae bacterium]|nr:hypothetical protein [Verrucomicrobiae bacterium]
MSIYAFTYAAVSHTAEVAGARGLPRRATPSARWYDFAVYAQRFQVDVLIRGERKPCPLEWLDQFCMRNFTNSPDFDDTLPVADGWLEASLRLTPQRFAEGLGTWLNQRGKGQGQKVVVEVTRV